MPADWTQVPTNDHPANLGSALTGARLESIENARESRSVRLRFALPLDAGPAEAVFLVDEATHLLTFVYLPPTRSLDKELGPEEAIASVGDWARQGLISAADPLTFETPLVVERALLYSTDETATLSVEGYGEDADRLVWWEVRVAGTSVKAV